MKTMPRKALLSALAILATGIASAQQSPAQFCTQQDRQFVNAFELWGPGIWAFVACFALPWLGAVFRFPFWLFRRPTRRWLLLTVTGFIAVMVFYCLLPVLASRRELSPETGLLGYPGIDPQYLLVCGKITVRGNPLFNVLGSARTTAIGQAYNLFLALAIAWVFWTLLLWVTFKIVRQRFGLIPRQGAGE